MTGASSTWQDRPGQFYVLLDTNAKPFTDPAQKQLAGKLRKCVQETGGGGGRRMTTRQSVKAGVPDGPPDHAARVELLLDAADEGIGDALKQFEKEQAIGERLNEVTEKYFEAHPRPFDAPWPSQARIPHLARARRPPRVHATDLSLTAQASGDLVLRKFLVDHVEEEPKKIVKNAKDLLGLSLS